MVQFLQLYSFFRRFEIRGGVLQSFFFTCWHQMLSLWFRKSDFAIFTCIAFPRINQREKGVKQGTKHRDRQFPELNCTLIGQNSEGGGTASGWGLLVFHFRVSFRVFNVSHEEI